MYYFYLYPLQFARFSGMLVVALWDGMQRPVFGTLYRSKIKEEGCIMKKLLALLMAVAVTFQLVTPVFADTEGTEEATAPTETVVETEAPTEAPTEETTAPTEETSAPTEATEETGEAAEETVEDIALFADNGDMIASGECGKNGDNLTWVLTVDGTLTISGSGEMKDYSSSSVARGIPTEPKSFP